MPPTISLIMLCREMRRSFFEKHFMMNILVSDCSTITYLNIFVDNLWPLDSFSLTVEIMNNQRMKYPRRPVPAISYSKRPLINQLRHPADLSRKGILALCAMAACVIIIVIIICVIAAQVQRSQPHSQRQLAQLQLRRRHSRRQLVPIPLSLARKPFIEWLFVKFFTIIHWLVIRRTAIDTLTELWPIITINR
jgi:hypothetical protein